MEEKLDVVPWRVLRVGVSVVHNGIYAEYVSDEGSHVGDYSLIGQDLNKNQGLEHLAEMIVRRGRRDLILNPTFEPVNKRCYHPLSDEQKSYLIKRISEIKIVE